MPAESSAGSGWSNLQAFLWLGLGSALTLIANGKWTVPSAAWLAPVFIMRFVRTQEPLRGFLWGVLATTLPSLFAWQGMVPVPPWLYFIFIPFIGCISFLPYLYDRFLVSKISGFASTLVFPVARTALEYLVSLISPYGSFTAVAYTQYGNLSLLQLLSITGISGVTFLVVWFASVINWVWEHEFDSRTIRSGVVTYASVFASVFLYGGARLALFPPESSTVRVACFTAFDQRVSRLPEDRTAFRQAAAKIQEDYLERTQQQARAGARIISWPEIAVPVAKEDEAALMERGRQVAREQQIFLLMSLHTNLGPHRPWENKIVLISPSGSVLWDYFKAKIPPGDPDVPGDGSIKLSETPFGRIAGVICFDMDFPKLIRQAGKAHTAILFAPYLDWEAIKLTHARMAVFRAIENGFSLVRPTSNGLSLIVDYQGRVLASMDHFTAKDRVLVGQVPTRGVTTLYSRIGEAFGWLCVAGFAMVLVWARRRGATDRTGEHP